VVGSVVIETTAALRPLSALRYVQVQDLIR